MRRKNLLLRQRQRLPREDERAQERTDEDTDDDVAIVVHRQKHDEVCHGKLDRVKQSTNHLFNRRGTIRREDIGVLAISRATNRAYAFCSNGCDTIRTRELSIRRFAARNSSDFVVIPWTIARAIRVVASGSLSLLPTSLGRNHGSRAREVSLSQASSMQDEGIILTTHAAQEFQAKDEANSTDAGASEHATRTDMPRAGQEAYTSKTSQYYRRDLRGTREKQSTYRNQ